MKFFLIFLLISLTFTQNIQSDKVVKLITESGYDGEVHQVETEDGYLLKVHRLRTKDGMSLKPPVFLQHGLFTTGADFLITGPKIALAYYLSDNGYDVWLGNSRGNKHSMNHKNLSGDSREFWMFSWHEMGYYDLPAIIDFMLNVTSASKAFYVGHSQGCTSLLVLLSTRPEYNDKIIQAHLMAPAVFMENMPHIALKAVSEEILNGLLEQFSFLEFELYFDVIKELIKVFCIRDETSQICSIASFFAVGPNVNEIEIDPKTFQIIYRHISPRQSVGQVVHFFQSARTGKFQWLNYGDKNIRVYNSSSPPDYDLHKVIVPTYIYHGTNDFIIGRKDVEHLKDLLPNVQEYRVIPNWNHADFCYGRNSRTVLYANLLQSFEADESL